MQQIGAAVGYTGLWRPNTQVHQLLSSRFQRLLLCSRQYLSQEVLRGVVDVLLDETHVQQFTSCYGKRRGTKKIPGAVQQTAPRIVRVVSPRPTLGILLHCQRR